MDYIKFSVPLFRRPSNGQRSPSRGTIFPGTGDRDGSRRVRSSLLIVLDDSPAETERDLHGVLVVRGFVEVLQRLHALVPRAVRRVAVIQHRFQNDFAIRVVPETRINEIPRTRIV